MGLSRLDNFLKNTRGNILYVSPNDVDATDAIENQGNSLARPFITIQRALIEASRFSYQKGLDNDRFEKTTILLYPGEHLVDNRPGWIPSGVNNYRLRNGTISNDFPPFDSTTSFDLTNPNNQLYKLNSVFGGAIIPRGVSIVGYDLRKTKIRPLYVPNPTNNEIEKSALFRVTGGCYFWQLTINDANPNGKAYVDYTTNQFVPNFSHHKLTVFEFADGVNGVTIDDDFQTYKTSRTDLDMYYEKIGLAYGQASGRDISPDYPSAAIDIQTNVNEYRIVGSTGASVGISSIKAGDGSVSSTEITVTTDKVLPGLDTDTIRIAGVDVTGYDGNYVISDVVSTTEIKYQVQNSPADPLPTITNATLNIAQDTVTSSSPYVFNCTLRSVFGMNGLYADGDKASGFKSMVCAQYTGISLQKDNKAFVKYDTTSGTYKDSTASGNENLSTDPRSQYKPEYSHYHIHATNDAFIQVVSCFAIGYASHFLSSKGGDLSITNSNSNFGAKALTADGYRRRAFSQDDRGYISHVIPPKNLEVTTQTFEYDAIDVKKSSDATGVGIASTSKLYLYNQTTQSTLPEYLLQGYRVGASNNDTLNVFLTDNAGITTEFNARIVMPPTASTGAEVSSKKQYNVVRSAVGINSIVSNLITLDTSHQFENGESIRILSDTGEIPDGLENDIVYYAITTIDEAVTGISNNTQLKVAKTLNDAVSLNPITINNKGGVLTIESRVSDKKSGDIGHPVQWDSSLENWYINVSAASTENNIHSTIVGMGTTTLGDSTARTFLKRHPDNRNLADTIYRLRYVIPKDSSNARPPLVGSVLQPSGDSTADTNAEIEKYYSVTTANLSNSSELRNFRFVSSASWASNVGIVTTELPHDLIVGSDVELFNIRSNINTTGVANTGFNGAFTVVSIPNSKTFSVGLTTDPGTFSNDTSIRDTNLPYFRRNTYGGTFSVYQSQTLQEYKENISDGIYQLTVTNSSNSPTVAPFTSDRFSQPIKNLYPRVNRDQTISDFPASKTFALSEFVGQTNVNDPEKSITRESLKKGIDDFVVGIAITDFIGSEIQGLPISWVGAAQTIGTAVTFFTSIDHGLNRITKLSVSESGAGYGNGAAGTLYNATLVGGANSTGGSNATARITVNGSGTLTGIEVMDGGSAYGIGNTMYVAGTATTTGFTQAVVKVEEIYDNAGDSLDIDNLPYPYETFNTLYEIVNVEVGAPKKFVAKPANSVAPVDPIKMGLTGTATTSKVNQPTGIGATIGAEATIVQTGQVVGVSTLTYDYPTGIATITTLGAHGLVAGNKFYMGGAVGVATTNANGIANKKEIQIFNGYFLTNSAPTLTSLTAKVGIGSTNPDFNENEDLSIYLPTFRPEGGNLTIDNDKTSTRNVPEYAGITTTLSTAVSTLAIDEITIVNQDSNRFTLGDYLKIDNEIVRIKQTPPTGGSDPIKVFRGVMGTLRQTHLNGSVVKRIQPHPVELRRNSLIRASGHTFEYVGFGPGNYSTSLPQVQTIKLSEQQVLDSQSFRKDGGLSNYSGMDDSGNFYFGNKKTSSTTGQVETFGIPIPAVTGGLSKESSGEGGFDIIDPLQVTVRRSISVEGGADGNVLSQFDGPVLFNKPVVSTSSQGIEVDNLKIQGNATVSRKFTVATSKPTQAGNLGDVVFYSAPFDGDFVGWVYTTSNEWKKFGRILPSGVETLPANTVGIATGDGSIGISSLVQFVGAGVSVTGTFDSTSGISTISFATADPETPANLYVSGLSTFMGLSTSYGPTWSSGIVTFHGTAAGTGHTNGPFLTVGTGITVMGGTNLNQLFVAGISTFGVIGTTGFDGNVSIGESSGITDRTTTVLAGDANVAGFEAMGDNSGTGYLYLGRNSERGGGIAFEGDFNPSFATGEVADAVLAYRKNAGANECVFSYPYDSNDVTFRGSIIGQSNLTLGASGIATAGIGTFKRVYGQHGQFEGANITGVITAAQFKGDGSNITGVPASGISTGTLAMPNGVRQSNLYTAMPEATQYADYPIYGVREWGYFTNPSGTDFPKNMNKIRATPNIDYCTTTSNGYGTVYFKRDLPHTKYSVFFSSQQDNDSYFNLKNTYTNRFEWVCLDPLTMNMISAGAKYATYNKGPILQTNAFHFMIMF